MYICLRLQSPWRQVLRRKLLKHTHTHMPEAPESLAASIEEAEAPASFASIRCASILMV